MRVKALAWMLACVSATLASGCGGSTVQPFRIGILSDCYGPAGGANELNVASAELPLIERGAKPLGREPSDGIGPVSIAGRRVELLTGCVAGTGDVIPEARRLVEGEGALAIVGPEDPSQGMALRLYARERPGTAFLIEPSAAPELTLSDPAANVFRFALDAAQSSAGLGTYAFLRLGWRRVVVVGDDVPYSWEEAAGFIAEFCALGGRVVDRVWVPLGTDPATAATGRALRSADGVYLAPAVSPMSAFLKRYASAGHDPSRELVSNTSLLTDPTVIRVANGVVVGGSPSLQPTPSERAYATAFAKAFPGISAAGALTGLSVAYRDGVEAVLQALEHARGTSLLDALGRVDLDSPLGRLHLDRNRQAIGPNYVSRIEPGRIKTVRVVPDVEQSFGGYFRPGDPPPSETSPRCVKRTPPPWAR
ncbi:MAG TPA: ABC transporter substrate-binding protein [Gaiellaceae bacterium]|nr:ABC transporter substrate-binding protein [Gaiellaceae bacterium]